MIKKSIILSLITLIMVVLLFNISCASSGNNQPMKESLAKAGEILGIEIPWPHYLPGSYKMVSVLVSGNTTTTLMISNNENKSIELEIMWKPTGMIPYKIDLNAPTVKFNGITGQLIESDEKKIAIIWNWYPERYKPGLIVLELFAQKDFPVSELTLIAGSVNWD